MEYKLSEQELKDLMHRTWLKAKKFYSGKTDEYFYDHFESEKKQLTLTDVSGMFSEKQMEEAWTDGCGCGESRSGYFDIENYR